MTRWSSRQVDPRPLHHALGLNYARFPRETSDFLARLQSRLSTTSTHEEILKVLEACVNSFVACDVRAQNARKRQTRYPAFASAPVRIKRKPLPFQAPVYTAPVRRRGVPIKRIQAEANHGSRRLTTTGAGRATFTAPTAGGSDVIRFLRDDTA